MTLIFFQAHRFSYLQLLQRDTALRTNPPYGSPFLYLFPADRAETEFRFKGMAAMAAYQGFFGRPKSRIYLWFYADAPAARTFNKRIPFFYTEEWKKEDGKIVVNPLCPCLHKSAGMAYPGLAVQIYCPRLYSCNNKKHNF